MNRRFKTILHVLLGLAMTACSRGASSGPEPEVPDSYAMLPDTMVCVLDRAAPAGLSNISAKRDGDRVMVLDGSSVVSLETLHPVNMIAGYAGGESWMRSTEPISYQGNTYAHIGGERRVAIELLERLGEYRGILLFVGQDDDPPPDALYVPTAPGCVFQPYVRSDLIRQ